MSRVVRATAAAGSALVLGVAAPAGAASVDGTPEVVNREVVQAELDSSGALDVARLFSQLSVFGKGTVKVADPTSSKGLRNLDGFGAPPVRDGKAQYTIHVDGTTSRRTVSEFTKSLPVQVTAAYTLGGRRVQAKDIVGKTGDVSVTYTIKNVSAAPTTVTWKDGKGQTHSETVDLVTPYVGQLTTTLPSSYTDLVTPAADVAADGRGGTLLAYSMVLFPPIGEQTQTFTWSGHVTDGLVPPVTVQVLPVTPSKKPELNTGVVGYRDGAARASELTAGAGLIDANLLKLQDGASELLAGLTKLAEGAAELRDGLTGKIAPGAKELADGADEAKAGSSALADGLDAADAGASELADGIGQILAGVKGLPDALAADPDYQALLGALAAVQAGIGTATDVTPTTLLGGLNLLTYGLRSPLGVTGCDQTASPGSATACGAADAVELVQEQLAEAVTSGGSLDQLIGAAQLAYAAAGCPAAPGAPVDGVAPPSTPGLPAICVYTSNLAYGLGLPAGVLSPTDLGGLKAQTATAAAVLGAVFAGIDDSIIPGIGQVKLGLSNPACDLTDPTDAANPCGIKQVQSLVSAGIGQLVDAISAELSAALSLADEGAGDLADGMSLLADGAGQLDDGLGKIAGGAGDLSDGLSLAADGSEQIADGLSAAKAGDVKIVDGAGQLRSEGTSKLVEGGNDTAGENAEKYATLVALGEKVADGALPYGLPDGARGSAAYQLNLAGADTASRDNATRAVLAVLILLAASAVSWTVRRRRVAAV